MCKQHARVALAPAIRDRLRSTHRRAEPFKLLRETIGNIIFPPTKSLPQGGRWRAKGHGSKQEQVRIMPRLSTRTKSFAIEIDTTVYSLMPDGSEHPQIKKQRGTFISTRESGSLPNSHHRDLKLHIELTQNHVRETDPSQDWKSRHF